MSPAPRRYTKRGRVVDTLVVSDASKLDKLHAYYLEHPPTPKEVKDAVRLHTRSQENMRRLLSAIQSKVGSIDFLRKEIERLTLLAKAGHRDLMDLYRLRKERTAESYVAAEALLKVHGRIPIEIEGRTYDFGCSGESVYLVPRVVKGQKRRKK